MRGSGLHNEAVIATVRSIGFQRCSNSARSRSPFGALARLGIRLEDSVRTVPAEKRGHATEARHEGASGVVLRRSWARGVARVGRTTMPLGAAKRGLPNSCRMWHRSCGTQ